MSRFLRRPSSMLLPVLLLAVGVIAWQHVFHATFVIKSADSASTHLWHIARDAALALPMAWIAVHVGRTVSNMIRPGSTAGAVVVRAAVTAQIFMVAVMAGVPFHVKLDEWVGATHVDEGGLLAHAVRDGLIGQAVALPLLVYVFALMQRRSFTNAAVLRGTGLGIAAVAAGAAAGLGLPLAVLLLVVVAFVAMQTEFDRQLVGRIAVVVAMIAGSLILPGPTAITNPAGAQTAVDADGCRATAPMRSYDVSAINVDMVFNAYGDHDPLGMMYVLDNRIADVRAQEAAGTVTPGLRQDAIQSLVIRANVGDCLEINFTNQLSNGMPASIHVNGLAYTAANDGGEVGNNPNSFADPGQTITYRFPISTDPNAEGIHHFHSRYEARQTMAHGLFGALVVEPAGSTYMDPEVPGQPIESGWEAIIVDPSGVDFREFVIMMHEVGDEDYEVLDVNDNPLPLIDDVTGIYRPSSRALNYRSEPFRNRLLLGGDESVGYSSYAFGDPATPIPRSYLGEPTKTRISHPGSEMFHVYHLHGGGIRWRRNPGVENSGFATGLNKIPDNDILSTRVDTQSAGPGESYDLEHECGAGGCQQAAGDYLFHCHIGHHYIAGMWSFWRVFDTVQPDLAVMPVDPGFTAPTVAQAGNSLDLIGQVVDGKTIVPAVDADQPDEIALEDYVATLLPPQGVTIDDDDPTVWDWAIDYVGGDLTQPLVLGEPATTESWPGYTAPNPGVRPEINFNLSNSRLAYPLFEPQLAKRPPFAPGRSGAPGLGSDVTATRPDGLCPTETDIPGRRKLHYPITAIDIPLDVTPSVTDPNGMLYVLSENVDAVRNGTMVKEPLVMRANVGDCISVLLTSQQEDANHEDRAKVNIHTHMVQFDPKGSDGVVTGYAWEMGVQPYAEENRTLDIAATPGDTTIDVSNVDRLREGITIGIGLGEGMCDPTTGAPVSDPDNADVPCMEIRTITDITGTVLTLDAPLANQHAIGEAVGIEFVNYEWYVDADQGTVFFHDHIRFSNWDHGLFGALIIEPKDATYHDPETGAEIRQGARADIHAPANASVGWGQQGSFREQMLFVHNAKIEIPGRPDEFRLHSINMRSEPWSDRGGDFPFSSVAHGDPGTPVVRAYLGDDVVLRTLGLVERIGALRVTGHRFRQERFAEDGTLRDIVNLGISSAENLILDGGAGGPEGSPGDYLFYNTKQEDLERGAWGILRVHDTAQGDLQPLPDAPAPPAGAGFPQLTETGGLPPAATDPGNPCGPGAPIRSIEVEVGEFPFDLADPLSERQFFALEGDVADILARTKPLEPLVIRMNAGECLEVGVRNSSGDIQGFNVSGTIAFDSQGSHGSAIGFNEDSTVDRGARRVYRIFADQELGTALFTSLADPRSAVEGAYGAIIVEPAGATWRDPVTGGPLDAGTQADVLLADGTGFREQVVLFEDTDDDIGQNVMPYPVHVSGDTGLNYSADPLHMEFGGGRADANDPASAYDSDVHGDPVTVLRAYTGDPVRFRVGVGSGMQAHTFGISGHSFFWENDMPNSERLDVIGVLPSESYDIHIEDGAGAGITSGADYLFENRRMPFHDAGLWGIMRTFDSPQADLLPLSEPGMLRVTTSPAVPSQILLDGRALDTWSTEWVKVTPGDYELCFTDVTGFTTPDCQQITISPNATTVAEGVFTPRGYLRVETSPAMPATIFVDGTPRNDWGLWTDVEPGDYEVCYGDVAGFATPACETVTVSAGTTAAATGTYLPGGASDPTGHGMLRVISTPALPTQITVDGLPMDTWATRWVKMTPGSYEVCFSDLEGWTTPSCETVAIVEGATAVVNGAFTQRGFLRVDTSPATPATISVDSHPRDDWGMWTHYEPGTYEVCFEEVGGITPPCETVTVTAGSQTTVTGDYS